MHMATLGSYGGVFLMSEVPLNTHFQTLNLIPKP